MSIACGADGLRMIRNVFSLYFIIVAILGPALCCCGIEPILSKKCTANFSPRHEQKKCCHHHSHKDAPDDSSSHEHLPIPFCPCSEHKDIPIALAKTTLDQFGFKFVQFSVMPFDSLFDGNFFVRALSDLNSILSLHANDRDSLHSPLVLRC